MRQMSRVGTGRFEPVQIEGGPHSRAIIQRPPDIDRPGAEFSYPSLTCRVAPTSLVKSGKVIRIPSGDRYLVGDHSATASWRTHHLFRADRTVNWQRQTFITDPVTRLQKSTGLTTAVPIWVMWEKVRREFTDLTVRIAQENHLMVTGADVQLHDIIEGMKVIRVNHALGLNVVEIQA